MTSPGWYLRRLSRMGPAEVGGRAVTAVRARRRRAQRDLHSPRPDAWLPQRGFRTPLPGGVPLIPEPAVARLLATADRLLDGRAEYFGVVRCDMVAPDWSYDPKTGRRAPQDAYAFDIPYRDQGAVGDIKQLWEPSRHQHLTVLAAAFAVTGDERYAHRVADHLKSWWAANPPLRGVHWISGIELGIRLLSWVWARRLLDGWPGAPGLFEDNPEAVHQILHHQRWLAAFRSRGSSANNHVIAEAAGQLAAGCAFPWFPSSERWRSDALRLLDVELRRNTFPSGLNRELASEYHGLVLELGLAAAAEAAAAGMAVPESTWGVLLRMTDALAAVVDTQGRPPRQGDGDDGYGIVLDGCGADRWASLLATGGSLFGRLDWWPPVRDLDVRTVLLAALAGAPRCPATRPARRPAHFDDAGLTILRARDRDAEIWCRCDGGPHGYLAIAAHAHADALSVEVRHDGVDVLADPGCYSYHDEPRWRSYFRSTLGHNTLELDGRDQSTSGGPFLWTRHARSRVHTADVPPTGLSRWVGEHHGYRRLGRSVVHRRSVELDPVSRELRITDVVAGGGAHRVRLAYHLGPSIHAEIADHCASLTWTREGRDRAAVLDLPRQLRWTAHRGETEPPLGWYSPSFGRKEASVTLIGSGSLSRETGALRARLRFGP
jgi:hypothetical protein